MPDRLKAAVIGAGSMGQNHIRIYHDLEQVELVAIVDASPNRENLARRYPVRTYQSHGELLNHEQLDLVTIAAPTNLHATIALATIGHKLPTLIEKPIAATTAEGEAIVAAAREHNVLVGIGHVERFNPAVTELKRRLDAGQLGTIFQISARRIGPFPARIQDVGVAIDLATHDIDAMHYLAGAPVCRLHAELGRRLHTNHEDLLTGLLRFDNDIIGMLEINWLSPTKVRTITVLGERGMFVANYLTQELFFYENAQATAESWQQLAVMGVTEGQMVRYNIPKREPLREELLDFVKAVTEGRPPLVSAEEGLRALAVAEQLIAQGGQEKRMSDSIDELLLRGKHVVLEENYPLARQFLSAVIQQDPNNEQGWLWLSGVVEDTARMRYCLQRVLAINPNNEHAAAALRSMKPISTRQPPPDPEPKVAPAAEQAGSAHRLRRRPSSMVEGDAVQEIVATHARVAWAYIWLWSGLVALNVVLQFAGRLEAQPFSSVVQRVALSAAAMATLLAIAWWITLRVLGHRAPRRALPHAEIYELATATTWPSALIALAALLAGFVGAVITQGNGDIFWFLHWVLLGAAALILPRMLIRNLVSQTMANARAARMLTAETLLVLGLLGGGALVIGFQLSQRIIRGEMPLF